MELTEGRYTIGGVDVLALCDRFGSPLYVYDADRITAQIAALRHAFGRHTIGIRYAAKALTTLAVLRHIRRQGCGIDAVSIGEARLALKAGFAPSDIVFTPNCVAFEEIVQGVEKGLTVNIDDLSLLARFGRRYGSGYPCGIRLNPNILAGDNYKVSTGHSHAKFGIPLDQMDEVMRVVARYRIAIEGLHIHVGSEVSQPDAFLHTAETLFDAALRFPGLRFLDFGSGFKPEDGRERTDIQTLGARFERAFDAFIKRYGRPVEFWFEPGKYLVSEAGYLLATVNVVKNNPLVNFVGVNSGLNHLIRPMMYDAYHEIVNVSHPEGKAGHYTIVGNICETDTFGADRILNEVKPGHVLAIKNAGAYSYSMSSHFNSRLKPAEVMIVDGEAKLIRRREVFEDLLKGQIDEDESP